MKNFTPSVLSQHGLITPIQSQPTQPKKTKYSFVCWRCGASKHLITLHVAGGPVRVCRDCAKGMGIK